MNSKDSNSFDPIIDFNLWRKIRQAVYKHQLSKSLKLLELRGITGESALSAIRRFNQFPRPG